MSVVTTYLINPAETYLDLVEGPGQKEVDVVALSNGGLAATSTNGGMTDLDIFTPGGNDGGGFLNFTGIYDTDSGGIFYDADGLGGAAGVRFAIVSTGLAITGADFDVV